MSPGSCVSYRTSKVFSKLGRPGPNSSNASSGLLGQLIGVLPKPFIELDSLGIKKG